MTRAALFYIASILFLFSSCSSIQTIDENKRLEKIFEEQWEWSMQEFPEWATYQGRTEYNHRWTDRSFEAIERREQHAKELLSQLDTIDRSRLSEQNQLNYDIYRINAERSVEGQRFPSHYQVINQMRGVQTQIDRILSVMPKSDPSDFDAIFERLESLPEVLLQQQALLARGLEKGVTPPQKTLRDVPRQLNSLLEEDFSENPLMSSFQRFPSSWDENERERIETRLRVIFSDILLPAVNSFADFFEQTYLPGTRTTTAMSDLPDGEAWYEYAIRGHTTTDLTALEIHDIGLREVRRIRQEMRDLVESTDFEGSLAEFISYLLNDPKFFYESGDELLRDYQALSKQIDGKVTKLFHFLPRTPYGVEKIPAHVADSAPAAYYQGGNLKNKRSGFFQVNTAHLNSRPKWEMEALTLHEAVPGHHLQIAIAQEMEDVPEFRRQGGNTAYIEGWALYAERLGLELDLYEDAYSDFGRLSFEMWRAVRLVVDTGMHALGWDRDKAIDYFVQNSGRARSEAVIEVDRYLVWPGQALAYKIGELKIKELREQAEEKLGSDFDVRDFHKEVLKDGPLPLSILEEKIHSWIEEVSKKS